MATSRGDPTLVRWSRGNPKRFALCGHHVKLMEFSDAKSDREQYEVEGGPPCHVVSTFSSEPAEGGPILDCGFSYDPNLADIFACAFPSGRVLILNGSRSTATVATEFTSRQKRACHCVSWNPKDFNLLAGAYDKSRGDSSLMVWNVEYGKVVSRAAGGETRPKAWNQIISELAGDSVWSVAWNPEASSQLFYASSKNIRAFDVRTSDKRQVAAVQAHSKNVQSILFNPFTTHEFASYAEDNEVRLWDVRKLVAPTVVIPFGTRIRQIAWSTARKNVLGVLPTIGGVVHAYNVDEYERERAREAGGGAVGTTVRLEHAFRTKLAFADASCVAWDPRASGFVLAAGPGGSLRHLSIERPPPVALAPHALAIAPGVRLGISRLQLDANFPPDPALVTARRARAGYGLNASHNVQVLTEEGASDSLIGAWMWVRDALQAPEGAPKCIDDCLVPIRSQLSSAAVGTGDRISNHPATRSARNRILELCRCGVLREGGIENFVARLVGEGNIERAVAYAVFFGDVERAVEVLQDAGEQARKGTGADSSLYDRYRLLALALAGADTSDRGLWRSTCRNVARDIKNPFLKTAFFLRAATNAEYAAVLSESDMPIPDRLSLAARILPDRALIKYIEELRDACSISGELDGFILVGMSETGLQLLGEYLNCTTDIQTVALLACAAPGGQGKGMRTAEWMRYYRDLLDMLQCWVQRAELDAMLAADGLAQADVDIEVACAHCKGGLLRGRDDALRKAARGRPGLGRFSSRLAQTTSTRRAGPGKCLHCGNALPRCSVCMRNVAEQSRSRDRPGATAGFQTWFCFCASCGHGGHMECLGDWFERFTYCPVAGCSCSCMVGDTAAQIASCGVEAGSAAKTSA